MISLVEDLPKPEPGQRRLFLKAGCPFCTKVVVFLAAAGIQDKVKPIYDCPPVREYVSQLNQGKCSFPAVELEEGKVIMLESADIIDFFMKEYKVDPERLWASRYFDEAYTRLPPQSGFGFCVITTQCRYISWPCKFGII